MYFNDKIKCKKIAFKIWAKYQNFPPFQARNSPITQDYDEPIPTLIYNSNITVMADAKSDRKRVFTIFVNIVQIRIF